MPCRELKRFTVVVSFSKVENKAAWSAAIAANAESEGGVCGGESGGFLRRVDAEPVRQACAAYPAASDSNEIRMSNQDSGTVTPIGMPPAVQNMWVTREFRLGTH